jgi:hypothetical protein
MSEKTVFYALLERADNADCSVPAFMTPGLAQLAEAVGGSKSTVVLALNHLEHHGWVIRKRAGSKDTGRTGRGHKTTYQLLDGFPCTPGCDYWRPSPGQRRQSSPPQKVSDDRTVSEEKASDGRTEKVSDEVLQTPTSGPLSDEGLVKGEVEQGQVSQLVGRNAAVAPGGGGSANGPAKMPPDWPLMKRLIGRVRNDDCGGLHRLALADELRVPPGSRAFTNALMIAYANKKIDFCGQYVVKPIPTRRQA